MRTLFILRHAQAASPAGTEDLHRPLTAQGMADARALGKLMKAKMYKPDFVVCSPARRAQQTYRRLAEALGDMQMTSPSTVYYTTVSQLYETLKAVDGNVRNLLLISHNPSIHVLAKFLAGIGTDDSMLRLNAEYKECTLTVLQCPIDGWATLMPNENDLADLLIAGRDFEGTIE
jgi:phosphohistidine phosphatase